jgi:PAS domain S-box-containing protein
MDEELQVVTKGIEKLTGYTVKEFSDNKRLWVNNVYPDDMLLLKENESILLSGSPLRQIYRIKTKKGEIKWVEENVFPTLDSYGNIEYVEGIVLDITEQKLKQEPNFNGVILTTVDLNGRFTSVSEQAAKLTGYTVQELYSMSYRDLLPEEEVKKVDDCFYNAIKGLDIQNRLISMKTKEQEIINVHVIGLPILQNGEIVGLYIITTDLSYHLQLEKNLLFSKPDFYQNYNTVNIGILVSEFNHPSESKILEANDFICNFLQYTHEEIQTKTFDDFALSHHNPVKAFSKNGGEYFHYRAVLLNKNGEKINVYLYNHLIQWNNHSAILSLVNPISNDEKTDSLLKDSGQRLRMLMAELNINTAELAHMTNLTPATISNLRTGKVKKPNIETANKISDALGVPVSHIWMDVNY